MTTPESGAPVELRPAGAPWRARLRALLPHVATALVAVLLSLAAEAILLRSTPPLSAPTVTPTLSPMPAPTAPPASPTLPAATQPPPATDILRQELIDLRTEDDRLWTAIYLSRAITQIDDAEATLRENDLPGVDQALIAVDDSLALAYARAEGPFQSPIDQLRREIDVLRSDLYLRPEGLDSRLARLRQTILSLIEERR